MKNTILKKLKRSILFYMILYIIIFVIINFILNIFSMNFRAWVYIFSLIFVCIGFVAGILQLLCNFKIIYYSGGTRFEYYRRCCMAEYQFCSF